LDAEDDGVTLIAARADRGAAEAAASAFELVDERAENAGAGGADRVAEGNRAAIDVNARVVDREGPDRVERDRGEGLVDLPEIDVPHGEADAIQRASDRGGGREDVVGRVGRLSVTDDLRQRRLAVGLRPLLRGQHDRTAHRR
jgi:hypothetical protein